MEGLIIGKVLWFNKAKGFGELYGEDGKAYFFTYREIQSKEKFKTIEKDTFIHFSPTDEIHLGLSVAGFVKEVPKRAIKPLLNSLRIKL